MCTEVCVNSNMDVSFLVALAFLSYFSRWLQHLARSHMMTSQGSEGTELRHRSMSLMSLCVGIYEEGVVLAFICPKRSNISDREASNAVFPKQVTSRYLAFSAKARMKSLFCKRAIHQNDWWGISGNPGFFYFPPGTSEVNNFWSTWSEVSCHNKVINVCFE